MSLRGYILQICTLKIELTFVKQEVKHTVSKKCLQEHTIFPLWTLLLIMGTELAAAPWIEWKILHAFFYQISHAKDMLIA